ncbi:MULTISPECIES: protein kinase domain-containing protein [unclassified Microcoleus]|uniref:protein kinase domain-containing protein n=1 Tax=unclassified Microcoleus TaxID=2642155 RepID=UPI002FCE83BF
MSYCLNPNCKKPDSNPAGAKFCLSCGTSLLLGDRYRPTKSIAREGFGIALLARDEFKPSNPPCVIKQFFPQEHNNAPKALELFRQEAVRLEQLGKHPQIPELLAHFESGDRLYIVQEFIDGKTLAQELVQTGPFREHQIRILLQDLLPVLQFIHSGKVIHRDIKPDNIIRRTPPTPPYQGGANSNSPYQGGANSNSPYQGGANSNSPLQGEANSNSCPPPWQGGVRGGLVLVDFGAAKYVAAAAFGETGTSIGSAGYAAPEQTIGKAVFASDIYSLGVTCIHLLTGMEPFDLYDASESKFVWPNYLIDNPVSEELARILNKMIELPLNKRYRSPDEVLQDLNSLVSQRQKPVLQLHQPQGRSHPLAKLTSNTFFQSSKSWLAAGILVMVGWGGHEYWRLTRWNLEVDTDRIGFDYNNMYVSKPDPDLCKQICAVDDQCQAFTYVRPGLEGDRARCYFKNGVPSPSLREGRSSSVKPRP